jgi:hypothetical protein
VLNLARKWIRSSKGVPERSFTFEQPFVLLHSDDWGRVGVRDKEGYEQLRHSGILLGQHPYDLYTLETADDVLALRDMLKQHRDYAGRSACMVMNFLTANLDFPKMQAKEFQGIELCPLSNGLPGHWQRPGLLVAYRSGIADGVFFPGLHGTTHFCRYAVERALRQGGERAELITTLWKAETPYIYWRMPWIGYEYNNPEKPRAGFLAAEEQATLIAQAAEIFKDLFGTAAVTACAPGYRANDDTRAAWARAGVRIAQNGSGAPKPPHLDEYEMLHLHRIIDFEPAQQELPLEKYLQLAQSCFANGLPVVISVHSMNFHSTLKNFRDATLRTLDALLKALEGKYPNLLYATDSDLYEVVIRGRLRTAHGSIPVQVTQSASPSLKSMARGLR